MDGEARRMSHSSLQDSAGADLPSPAQPVIPGPPDGSGGPPLSDTSPNGRPLAARRRFGAESLFRGTVTGAGTMVLVIIAAIATFLIVRAIPALRVNTVNFFTYKEWFPDDENGAKFGIAALAYGTLLT